MAKAETQATLPPAQFAIGQVITNEDIEAVIEQLNYAANNNARTHVNLVTGPFVLATGDHGANTYFRYAHGVRFLATSAASREFYSFKIWVDADVQEIRVTATCTIPAANGGTVHFVVGGGSSSISEFTAGTATDTEDLATSATGTGWLTVTVSLEHSTGSGGGGNEHLVLDSFVIEDLPIDIADWIDPPYPL